MATTTRKIRKTGRTFTFPECGVALQEAHMLNNTHDHHDDHNSNSMPKALEVHSKREKKHKNETERRKVKKTAWWWTSCLDKRLRSWSWGYSLAETLGSLASAPRGRRSEACSLTPSGWRRDSTGTCTSRLCGASRFTSPTPRRRRRQASTSRAMNTCKQTRTAKRKANETTFIADCFSVGQKRSGWEVMSVVRG